MPRSSSCFAPIRRPVRSRPGEVYRVRRTLRWRCRRGSPPTARVVDRLDPGIDRVVFRMPGKQPPLSEQIGAHARIAHVWNPMLHRPQTLRAQPLTSSAHPLPRRLRSWSLRLRRHCRYPSFRNMLRRGRGIGKSDGVSHISTFSAAMNASCGISTLPNWRMRFLPSYCFSRSLRLCVTSPP